MVSVENKDKEWWEKEFLAQFDETLNLSSLSYELVDQSLALLESDYPDAIEKIDKCLAELKKNSENGEKILEELKEKLEKKYPVREYDPRLKMELI